MSVYLETTLGMATRHGKETRAALLYLESYLCMSMPSSGLISIFYDDLIHFL